MVMRDQAIKSLEALRRGNKKLATRVADKIEALKTNPRPDGCLKLVGQESTWRVKVKDFRIIYEIHDEVLVVTVIDVAARKDAYR